MAEAVRRVLLLAQKPIGEACFALALEAPGIAVVGACSNVSPTVWWGTSGVHDACRARGLPLVDNAERAEDALLDLIARSGAEILISVQHAWILSQRVIDAVGGRAFNLHMARLPQYKGYHPFAHAILNGDAHYAVTIHWMAARVDSGAIAYEAEFPIGPADTAADLYRRAEAESLGLFRHLLADLGEGRMPPARPLAGEHRFYSRHSIAAIARIADPTDPVEVDRKARALYFPPFPPAYLDLGGTRVFVLPSTFRFNTADR